MIRKTYLIILLTLLQGCASIEFEPDTDIFTGEITHYPAHTGEVLVFAHAPSFSIRYDTVGTFSITPKTQKHTSASLLALLKHHAAQKGANALIIDHDIIKNNTIVSSLTQLLKNKPTNTPRTITAQAIRIKGSIRGLLKKLKDDVIQTLTP